MYIIEKIVKINGKAKELEPDNREIRTVFELEQYRNELQERYKCEIEFVYKEVRE